VEFLIFLVTVFLISCSGAMQPGPVTATAIKMGTHNRWAGTLIAIGHGVIEFPLMVIIIFGIGEYFKIEKVQIVIGLAGGSFLLIMAAQSFISLKSNLDTESKALQSKPVLAGIILSGSNPYFLFWWATVGLALATKAVGWGIWAFVLFALTHWFVDLIWLQLLSFASFKGSVLLGKHGLKIVLAFCAAALLFFGLYFILSAVKILFS
jgi:threonine/homoserine/homoserine lactone efflux protein